jgi:hypothetical protein
VQVGTVLQRDPRAKTYVVEKYHGYKICSIKNLMCVHTLFAQLTDSTRLKLEVLLLFDRVTPVPGVPGWYMYVLYLNMY